MKQLLCDNLFNSKNPKDYFLEISKKLGIESIIKKALILKQNKYHNELLLDHLINCYQYGIEYTSDPIFGIACLFHDIGKVITQKWSEEKNDFTYHKHEYVGALIVKKWTIRWGFSTKEVNRITNAIRQHQFRVYDNTKDSTIKAWLSLIGQQTWEDIRILRLMDRMANQANKEKPVIYKKYIEIDNRISRIAQSL